jgi:hypothetical protein
MYIYKEIDVLPVLSVDDLPPKLRSVGTIEGAVVGEKFVVVAC